MALATVTDQQAVAPAPIDFVYPWARVLEPKNASDPLAVEASISMASQEVRTRIHGTVDAAIAAMQSEDTVLTLEYEERNIAGVINDAALVESATASVESVLGAGSVGPLPAVVPAFSEDFGSFQNLVPGVLFFLGVSNPEKGIVGMPHTPGYAADDEAIFVGARSMGAVLLDFLGSQPGG
jgi:metal-dependent amidase/aminoacylase/carboxypeptidase family protein